MNCNTTHYRANSSSVPGDPTLTVIGLILGLGASYYLVRVMRSILYEVEPSDLTAITGASALLLVTALVACWRPARRAMKVDPVSLLREQ